MNLRFKLIAAFLVVGLLPVGIVGFVSLDGLQSHTGQAQAQSEAALTEQIEGDLNQSVQSYVREIENQMDDRRVDVRSLAESPAVQNYHAASEGEMELVQGMSQDQLGYASLQMRDGLEALTETILESEYDGREWEDLSESEQQAVEERVRNLIGGNGTEGSGLAPSGTMYDQFQPGYIGDTGYFYATDLDSNIVLHHNLEYGFDLIDEGGLAVFEEIRETIRTDQEIRNGEDWGVAEYDWEDTTQEGDPIEEKFISYTYYDKFGWIIAPNVYYYELQQTAVEDARMDSQHSFENYLETRTISIDDEEHRLYDEIILTEADGTPVVRSHATEDGTVTSGVTEQSYADTDWFRAAEDAPEGAVSFGSVRTTEDGQHMYISMPVHYDGTFEGVVAVRFDYSTITELTNSATVGDSGRLAVVNPDGQFVSHSSMDVLRNDETVASLGTADLSEAVLAGETGLDRYSMATDGGNGSTHFVAHAPFSVGDEQYALLATVPEQEVLEPVSALGSDLQSQYTDTRDLIAGLLVLILVGAAGVGFVGARRISKPIEQVRDRATALSDGQIEEWDDIDARDDEIGEMVTAFESLRHELEVIAAQANALADQRFDDPAFEEEVSGQVGEALRTMHEDTQAFAEELEEARAEARAEAEELANALEQKAVEFGDVMEQAADGDLTRRLSTDSESEAMREIAETYNEMMADLEGTIVEIQSFAEEVAVASEEASTGAGEAKRASEEVSSSIQEISSGAHDQREKLERVSDEMNNLSATIEEAASSAQTVAETSQETAAISEDGETTSQHAIEEMEEVQRTMEATVENVEELDGVMDEIGEIVDLISEIAEQTNMLALNANIEAARAGEGGGNDGFAVVADEIKQLAGETQQSAEEVDRLIEEVQNQSDATVADIRSAERRVREATESVGETAAAFERVAENVEETDDGVQEINDAVEVQAESAAEVVSMVDDVTDISQETADEAENVSAAAEEQASSMSQISTNVSSLTERAEQLQQLLDRFEAETERAETVAKPADDD